MEEKEKFIFSIKQSLVYQTLAGLNMSYISVKNKIICPFCHNEIISKKTKKTWSWRCDCKESIMTNDALNIYIKEIEEAQDKAEIIFKKIRKGALKYFQNVYQNEVIDLRNKEYEKIDAEILNIDSID